MLIDTVALRARALAAVNGRLQTVAGGRWAGHCWPSTINILLTERCNARCVHCDIWKNRGREDQPTLDQWKAAITGISNWLGPVHVVFTGGEALLVPFAPELVAHATSLGLLVEHLTHGYWPDPSRVERMALARPWRITISFDGLGAIHDRIRGRDGFFEHTAATIDLLVRLRESRKHNAILRLKTVIMEQNLDGLADVAHYAQSRGLEVFYQPIEQNYNTPDDLTWYEQSQNWPRDPEKAVAAVERLISLKREGLPIANSVAQLEVMVPYFRDPAALQFVTQNHVAHHKHPLCAALTDLQIQSNGDVKSCWNMGPIGNIRSGHIREFWRNRPRLWEGGCCVEQRTVPVEELSSLQRMS